MLEIKNTVTKMESVFGPISRLDTDKDRISEIEDKSVEITQTGIQKGKKM